MTTSPQLRESPETANTQSPVFGFAADCAREEIGHALSDAIKSAAETNRLRRFTSSPPVALQLATRLPFR